MAEEKETGKKPLGVSNTGRLELKKTVGAGQVRQNFSHGRSKSVAVEVKRKRTFKADSSGSMTEVKVRTGLEASEAAPAAPEPAAAPKPEKPAKSKERPAVLRTLTEEEKDARAQALKSAKVQDEINKVDAAKRAAEEARQAEEDRLKREAEERAEAEKAAKAEKEAAAKEAEQAEQAKQETAAAAALEEAKADASAPPAPEKRTETADKEEEERKKSRTNVRKPSSRRGEQRRRSGKLTIAQALDDEEKVRSLASVRRARERERREQQKSPSQDTGKVVREVTVPETITVQELANRMAVRGPELIKTLMNLGTSVAISETIDADTAELAVSEYGHRIKRVSAADVEVGLKGPDDDDGTLEPRPPVVTVMGHVDHGKTSLLDALRQADVVSGEAGGITQHIGAYQVTTKSGNKITFVDTPGHAAFTQMRARGARVTDIVVLVVAADDGIMPQTVEAIDHAKAAEVPIIVAINKIDRPEADADRVRNELLQHELVTESMGGDILCVEVSATKKTNLDKLEEAIILQSELMELKASRERSADGVVVEAKLDRGRGAVATLLVQRGTLKRGDILVAGNAWGKVRALSDDGGASVKEAGPSVPVEVLGLDKVPMAGDEFVVVDSEARAREVIDYRVQVERDSRAVEGGRGTLEQMFDKIAAGEAEQMPVVIKSDVQGTAEAIQASLEKLGTDEVSVQFLHTGVGGINESDVTLAAASGAVVLGFNVRANSQARLLAEDDNVDIRYYSIIYDLTEDVKSVLSGMLAPEARETIIGNARIKETFNISKVGQIAGCEVTDGMVRRGASVRLLRDSVVIHEGTLATLKRFKDEVREVSSGMECGMAFENYHDLKVGDVIECYEVEQIARTL